MATRRYLAKPTLRTAVHSLRRSGERQYKVALASGFDQTRLSQILIGAVAVRSDDHRVLKLLNHVGLTFDEAFRPLDEPQVVPVEVPTSA